MVLLLLLPELADPSLLCKPGWGVKPPHPWVLRGGASPWLLLGSFLSCL